METYLYEIARDEKPNLVSAECIIEFGVDIDAQSANGDTALHISALYSTNYNKTKSTDMVKLLLKNGAKHNIKNSKGLIPIELSLLSGNLEICEELLKEDKLPNVVTVDRINRCRHLVKCLLKESNTSNKLGTNYSFLLHFLVLENDEESFENVAKNTEFDVNAVNFRGNKLLYEVINKGTPRMIRALIDAGADLQTECDLPPLVYATRLNRTEIINCLLDRQAPVNQVEIYKQETNSPLHYAVCRQNFEIVEKLVMMGADVNALTLHRSPLLLACGSILTRLDPFNTGGIITLFCEDNSKLKDIREIPFSVKIVEFLLDHGANMEAKNASGRTPLDEACKGGRLDIVQLLLNRGAKINQGSLTTLHLAITGKNLDIIKLILEQGADVNCGCKLEKKLSGQNHVKKYSSTPLEYTLNYIDSDTKCKDIVRLLIEYGVDVNLANPKGKETPLHLLFVPTKYKAKWQTKPETIYLLLRYNADVNALDNKGNVPLNYAIHKYAVYKYNKGWHSDSDFELFNYCEPDVLALLTFISKMVANKEYVIQQNLILLKDWNISRFYNKCKKDLKRMKKKNICETHTLSFFDILCKDIPYLSRILRNQDIRQVFDSKKYTKYFRMYNKYFRFIVHEASIHQIKLDSLTALFHTNVNKKIVFDLIVFNIFKFLDSRDLQNFASACFADV